METALVTKPQDIPSVGDCQMLIRNWADHNIGGQMKRDNLKKVTGAVAQLLPEQHGQYTAVWDDAVALYQTEDADQFNVEGPLFEGDFITDLALAFEDEPKIQQVTDIMIAKLADTDNRSYFHEHRPAVERLLKIADKFRGRPLEQSIIGAVSSYIQRHDGAFWRTQYDASGYLLEYAQKQPDKGIVDEIAMTCFRKVMRYNMGEYKSEAGEATSIYMWRLADISELGPEAATTSMRYLWNVIERATDGSEVAKNMSTYRFRKLIEDHVPKVILKLTPGERSGAITRLRNEFMTRLQWYPEGSAYSFVDAMRKITDGISHDDPLYESVIRDIGETYQQASVGADSEQAGRVPRERAKAVQYWAENLRDKHPFLKEPKPAAQ